jgi:hypothetical protein
MAITIRPRADRVALGIPILYHRPGDDHWFRANLLHTPFVRDRVYCRTESVRRLSRLERQQAGL